MTEIYSVDDGDKLYSMSHIGFRLQFFCTKCNRFLSPKNLDERGCPECSRKLDLLLR
jgi:Zn finger protein HypA/HybF involved in hydrogenase expression